MSIKMVQVAAVDDRSLQAETCRVIKHSASTAKPHYTDSRPTFRRSVVCRPTANSSDKEIGKCLLTAYVGLTYARKRKHFRDSVTYKSWKTKDSYRSRQCAQFRTSLKLKRIAYLTLINAENNGVGSVIRDLTIHEVIRHFNCHPCVDRCYYRLARYKKTTRKMWIMGLQIRGWC